MKAGMQGTGGAALIVMVLALLQMSLLTLLMLNNHQQQLMALASLDDKALQRSLAMRQLFDELAQQVIDSGTGAAQESGKKVTISGQRELAELSLQYQILPIDCQHLDAGQNAGTSCWSLSINEQDSGFSRQRQLHVAESNCGVYWYVAEAG